ncbi:MAG: efflux RND transporter permease subunit, partial [Rikenellaceae bacterium]
IEREVQSMRYIYKITSESQYGLSMIYVELDPATPPDMIPQLWDELRRKILNVTPKLPSGASAVVVSDDFGDVYGIYYALSASDGYSFSELRSWAQRLKTAIVAVDGVQKVTLFGEQSPVINIYISLSRLSNFSIRPDAIITTIARQNSVINSGEKEAGEMHIRIIEEGSYNSVEDIANQLLIASDGKQYRLGDIARVERSYAEPSTSLMQVNGRKAIGIGISTAADKDVVATGDSIRVLLDEFTAQMPLGVELEVLYPEDRIAREATNSFLINLMESIGIVIVVIMFVMGLRAGVLIGSSLLFSIGATMLIMLFVGEGLNRTSLAGFIIAMGMLVDNAIVVVDNAQNAIRRGASPIDGVTKGADRPKWSLLGATLIAIFSFLPLYLAPSGVAEIIKPLFIVLSISLLISWVLALTQTPLFGLFLLKSGGAVIDDETKYNNRFYLLFEGLLCSLLRHRLSVIAIAILLFIGSILLMGRLPQSFFPSLDKPYFRADIILPEGWNIDATEQRMSQMERWLSSHEEVKQVSITAGGSPPRYYLASSAYSLMPNYGNILVELRRPEEAEYMESKFNRYVRENYPDVWIRSSLFKLSPLPDATIEMGFIGDNIDTLINLCSQANQIMWRNPDATNIRNSWGNRVPTWQPIYSQMRGGRIGISRSELIQGMMVATTGITLGEYREGDQLMPILMKDAHLDEFNLSNLSTLPVFSPTGRLFIAQQATSGFDLSYTYPVIKRFNRQRVMKAQCDPDRGVNTKTLFNQIKDSVVRQITIPTGYQLRIFGEEETQEESNDALAKNFPLTIVLIFITLLLLFGSYSEPLSILLVLPLILIGVILGLWVSGKMFDFFALLGLLGLIGMNIKNGVVLIDYIGELRAKGVEDSRAIIEATRSRIVPVAMASGTTILGMIPLLFDSLFGAMAATIMGGLVVATLLTFSLLPIIYALLMGIKIK